MRIKKLKFGKMAALMVLSSLMIGMATSAVRPDRTPSTECSGDEFLQADNNCLTSSQIDTTVADNQNLKDVLSRGNSTGSYDIDMNGNDLRNMNHIYTSGTTKIIGDGTSLFTRFENSAGNPVLDVKDSGNIEVPNGDLNIGSGNIQMGGNPVISRGGSHNNLRTVGRSWSIYDTANSRYIFQAYEGGPVQVKNADLIASKNINISDGGVLQAHGASSGIQFYGNGNVQVQLEDSANDIFQVNNNGSTTYFRVDRGGPVQVKNAKLDMSGNSIDYANRILEGSCCQSAGVSFQSGSVEIKSEGGGSGAIHLKDGNSGNNLLTVNEGGPIKVNKNIEFQASGNNTISNGVGSHTSIATNHIGRSPMNTLSDWQTGWVLSDAVDGTGNARALHFLDENGNRVAQIGNGGITLRQGTLNMLSNNVQNVNKIDMNQGFIVGDSAGVQIRGDGGETSGWFRDDDVYIGNGDFSDTIHVRGTKDFTGGNLDMNQNQIDNIVVDKRSSDPSSPANGQIWYRTDLD